MATKELESEVKELKAAVNEIVEQPIAAKLKAEPGWRAVLFVIQGEEDNMQKFYIVVQPVKHWALEAPTIVPPKADSAIVMRVMSLFGGAMPTIPLKLWPIDVHTGKRLGESLHRLVPPCDRTDAQLVEEAQLWCAELNEKNKTTPP